MVNLNTSTDTGYIGPALHSPSPACNCLTFSDIRPYILDSASGIRSKHRAHRAGKERLALIGI